MYLTSISRAKSLGATTRDASGAIEGVLISADTCGAVGGEVRFVEVPPRQRHEARPCAVEAAAVLVSGDSTVTVATGSFQGPGSVAYVPAGGRMSVQAQDELGVVLSLYGGTVTWTDDGYHEGAAASSACFAVHDQVDHPFHIPEMGFFDMSARWLVDGASRGSSSLTLGQSTFAPRSGRHELHRHPNAEEIFYVWEGSGVHLTEDGEHPISAGDIVLVPRNEWHGVRNTSDVPLRAIFGYLGVNSLDDGGYEMPPST